MTAPVETTAERRTRRIAERTAEAKASIESAARGIAYDESEVRADLRRAQELYARRLEVLLVRERAIIVRRQDLAARAAYLAARGPLGYDARVHGWGRPGCLATVEP